jgi:large subunit ribosomal protein L5
MPRPVMMEKQITQQAPIMQLTQLIVPKVDNMAYATLHDRLRGPIAQALKEELKIKNVHALPKLEKVIVNVGINRMKIEGKEMQEFITDALMNITGQMPVFRASKKSISNFKITKGRIVGAVVTLRGRRMEEFTDRLVSYVLPRIRDFRGLPIKMDGKGNYAIGLKDHSVFPEIPNSDMQKTFGLQIQFTTTAKNDEEAKALMKQIGMPFRPDRVAKA